MTLATFVTVGSGQVLDGGPPIDPDCQAKGTPCANLYLYDENDVVVHIIQGTNDTMGTRRGVKGIYKVQTVGEYGSYTIYIRKNHGGSGSFCWEGNDKISIGPGSGTDYEYTKIGSVKYDPVGSCPSQAGIPPWAIAVSVLVVLLVAVAIFLVYRSKRANHDPVSTNDGV